MNHSTGECIQPDPATPEHHEGDSQELSRGLGNRHLQLMAIGGAIGTGLFMGSGKTITLAGPSVLLIYAIVGFMLFFVMRAMGELLLSNLKYKSFRDAASDLIGPAAGFVIGWTYWFCWIVTGTADIVVIAGYVMFWFPNAPAWLVALCTVALLFLLNLLAVRAFGEAEFWFAIIKIVAIVALIVIGLVMVFMSFQHPDSTRSAISNLWNDGGFFPNGLTGFLAGFQIAVFAFVGIELAGTAAAETKDPTKTLPRTINTIPIRVVMFYLVSLAVIMMVTPWRMVSADQSPFVSMFTLAGIPAAASIINFVMLTSAASSANSGIYSTSRILYGLAIESSAPRQWRVLSKHSIPARALLFSVICLSPGIILLYAGNSVMQAFTIVTTLSAVMFMVVWDMILITYLFYRRDRPELHEKSLFKVPFGKVMPYVVLVFFVFILVVLLLEPDTRAALACAPIWFVILGIAWRIRTKKVNAASANASAPDSSGAH